MNGEKKGINFLPEKEEAECRCCQRDIQLAFLDICLDAAGSCDGFVHWDEDECDWPVDGTKSVQRAEYFSESTDL